VQFSQAWPWGTAPWQDLWTVVQYQKGPEGGWVDVEGGWRGGLDDVVVGEDGEIVGKKVWWVAEADLGRGPFRWRVYRSKGGWLLITSEQFYLPSLNGGTVTVEVSLEP